MASGQQPHPYERLDDPDIRAIITQNILTPIPPLPISAEPLSREERLKTIIQNREKIIAQVKTQIISSALSAPEIPYTSQIRNPPHEISQKANDDLIVRVKDPNITRHAQYGSKKPGSTYANPISIDQAAPLSQPVKVVKALELMSDSTLARLEQDKWDNACIRIGIPYPGREGRKRTGVRAHVSSIAGSPSESVAASPTMNNAPIFRGSPQIGGPVSASSPVNSGSPMDFGSPQNGSPIDPPTMPSGRTASAGTATMDPRRGAKISLDTRNLDNAFVRPGVARSPISASSQASSLSTSRRQSLSSVAPVTTPGNAPLPQSLPPKPHWVTPGGPAVARTKDPRLNRR